MKARPLTILRWTGCYTIVGMGLIVAASAFVARSPESSWREWGEGAVLGFAFYGTLVWLILSALLLGVFWIDSLISNRRAS